MTISLYDFTTAFLKTPTLQITTILILGVILVNGATDAPNAIASLVASGGMELKPAVRMAAFFNFAGLALMTICNANVAYTICHMVDFGDSPGKALTALCAALISIILWSAAAWCFGIPTSESHALIAGLTGAAIAIHNGLSGIHGMEWIKVLYGLAASSILGFSLGWMGGKGLSYRRLFKGYAGFYKPASRKSALYKPVSHKSPPYKPTPYKPKINETKYEWGKRWIRRAQIAGAAAMAFMHGAQDGQKFMGVFLLGIFLSMGKIPGGNFHIPLWMTVLCSVGMATGTAIGGERIIKTVGMDMVKLGKAQGAVSDAAAAACLLLSSLTGIPVSTTHVKTTAIMGVGIASDGEAVNKSIMKEMILAWVVTFPCCGVIGYIIAKVFIKM
ncbi:inorganic phosphate transporter [Lachnospiraceae bacterium]|nr:inorganic phosphate transporter [Lachnospiraceae bacterium]